MEGTEAALAVPVEVGDEVKNEIKEVINSFFCKMTPVLREKAYDFFLEKYKTTTPGTGNVQGLFSSANVQECRVNILGMTPPKVTAVTNLNMESEAFANTKPVTWRYTPVQYYTKAFPFDKWARLASLSGDTLQVQQFLLRNLHIGSRLSSGKKVL